MSPLKTDADSLLAYLRNLYQEKLPFNRVLGVSVRKLTTESVTVAFAMKAELIGNPVQETLHGGVVSATLDATGGLLASASMVPALAGGEEQEIRQRFARVGTIDLRVDYLRPGRGRSFCASAAVMRSGRKVAVTRMELVNDDDILIAVGTGTYSIG